MLHGIGPERVADGIANGESATPGNPAMVREPRWIVEIESEGNYGRLVADRRFGRIVVRVIYNVGRGEYVIVAVMRRRRLGGGGGP